MALEGTHIRFAVDTINNYNISRLNEYISGAIYPDSRYITKTDRQLTHPKDFQEWDIFNMNDFIKGWFTHLLCDSLHLPLIQKRFPNFFVSEIIEQNSEDWVKLTAVKVLQDLNDVKSFNVVDYLPNLASVKAENGEDINMLIEYYRVNLEIYSNPQQLTLESYGIKLHRLGLDKELAEAVVSKAIELSDDQKTMAGIQQIYPEILSQVQRGS